jgi:hypothetical protein
MRALARGSISSATNSAIMSWRSRAICNRVTFDLTAPSDTSLPNSIVGCFATASLFSPAKASIAHRISIVSFQNPSRPFDSIDERACLSARLAIHGSGVARHASADRSLVADRGLESRPSRRLFA